MELPAASKCWSRNEVEVAPAWSRPSGVLPLVIPICSQRAGEAVRHASGASVARQLRASRTPASIMIYRQQSACSHLGGTEVDMQLLQVHDVLEHPPLLCGAV